MGNDSVSVIFSSGLYWNVGVINIEYKINIWSTVNDSPGLLLSNGISMGGWRNTAGEHVLDASTVHQCLGICQVICIDAVHKVAWLLNTPLIITPPGEWTQQIYLSLRPCSHHWAVLNESVHVWRQTLKEKLPQAFMQIGWMEDNLET